MASRRDIRILALQALYQLDSCKGGDHAVVKEMVVSAHNLIDSDEADAVQLKPIADEQLTEAAEMAIAAWDLRKQADDLLGELAPGWPASRQPAMDRAIVRLSWFEMSTGKTPPKAVINEAVDLARQFSTEKSPAFINGVLDKMYKRLRDEPTTASTLDENQSTGDAWLDDALTKPVAPVTSVDSVDSSELKNEKKEESSSNLTEQPSVQQVKPKE